MSLRNPRTISEALEGLRRLPEAIRVGASARLAPKIQTIIEGNWDAGRSPYGGSWAAKADGSPSRLNASGAMRGTLKVTPTSDGIGGCLVTIDSPFEYHQYGTSKMPARPLLPTDGGVPGEWRQAVVDSIDEAVDTLG